MHGTWQLQLFDDSRRGTTQILVQLQNVTTSPRSQPCKVPAKLH